jgi:hypothetical protein
MEICVQHIGYIDDVFNDEVLRFRLSHAVLSGDGFFLNNKLADGITHRAALGFVDAKLHSIG